MRWREIDELEITTWIGDVVKRDRWVEIEITTWICDKVKRDRWVRDNNLNRWCSEER